MSPLFLLDTSICVAVLRNQARLDKLPHPSQTGIPAIVAAELWVGVEKNQKTHPQKGPHLAAFLALFQIVDFTHDAARHYAEIRAALEGAGKSIGPFDLLIAAQARAIGATLVTANVSEFKRVSGLQLLAWK